MIVDPLTGGLGQLSSKPEPQLHLQSQSQSQPQQKSSEIEDWHKTLNSVQGLESQGTQQIQTELQQELYELRETIHSELTNTKQQGDEINQGDDDFEEQRKVWKKEKETLEIENNKQKYRILHMRPHQKV